jgi:hypothetical protein
MGDRSGLLKSRRLGVAVLACLLGIAGSARPAADAHPAVPFALKADDVVVFVGGESVVQQAEGGHLESVLAAAFPETRARFRNLGREGDTVYDQPRDLNFPGLGEQLEQTKATVVVAHFGRTESLDGRGRVTDFAAAYDRLCDVLAKGGRRVVLVSPLPFERPTSPLLPDLSARNANARLYAEAAVELAARRGYPVADVFAEVIARGTLDPPLTQDGQRPTAYGLAVEAAAIALRLRITRGAGPDVTHAGEWARPDLEAVRLAVVAKNKLWFEYVRPMNWAFLGGERQSVPSSRDPDDLNVRVFPREMEKYVPLIRNADAEVERLAGKARRVE